MKNIELGSNSVICQKWEESECGWGRRPDGFSLHISYAALRKFIEQYWDGMPDVPPDEYSRPDGTPYPVGVSDDVYQTVKKSGDGVRYSGLTEYPGSGGLDGWMPQ